MSVRRSTASVAIAASGACGGECLSGRLRAVLTLPDTGGWLPEGQPDYSKPGCDPPPKPGEKRGIDDGDRCNCAICVSPLEESDEHGAPFLLGRTCEHQFHGRCLYDWVRSSEQARPGQGAKCPSCRVPIDPADVADLSQRFEDQDGWLARVRNDRWAFKDVPADSDSYLKAGLIVAALQPYWTAKVLKEDAPVFAYQKIATVCVRKTPSALAFVSPERLQQRYPRVAVAAMDTGYIALKFVPPEPYIEREYLVDYAIQHSPRAIEFARTDDKKYNAVARRAVGEDTNLLRFIKPHAEYEAVALQAIINEGSAIRFVLPEFASAKLWEVALRFSQADAIRYLPNDHPEHFQLAMRAMQIEPFGMGPHPLQILRQSGRYDPASSTEFRQLLREAIKHDKTNEVLSYAPESLRGDGVIALEAIRKSREAIWYVPPDAPDFGQIAEYVVTSNRTGMATINRVILPSNSAYKRIAMASVTAWPETIEDVNPSCSGYKDVAIMAVTRSASTLRFVKFVQETPESSRDDYFEIALEAVRAHPSAMQFVNPNESRYLEVLAAAIEIDYLWVLLDQSERNTWYWAAVTLMQEAALADE